MGSKKKRTYKISGNTKVEILQCFGLEAIYVQIKAKMTYKKSGKTKAENSVFESAGNFFLGNLQHEIKCPLPNPLVDKRIQTGICTNAHIN